MYRQSFASFLIVNQGSPSLCRDSKWKNRFRSAINKRKKIFCSLDCAAYLRRAFIDLKVSKRRAEKETLVGHSAMLNESIYELMKTSQQSIDSSNLSNTRRARKVAAINFHQADRPATCSASKVN